MLSSTPRGPPPLISVLVTPPTPPTQPTALPANPSKCEPILFEVRNIRVCQGCRGSLKTSDGAVPSLPFDLAVACAEQGPFCDSSGDLITPKRPTVYHYHCKLECIKAVKPHFIPSSVRIPEDVHPKLCTAHIQHLLKNFQVSL